MEVTFFDRVHDFFTQHQVLDIGLGDDHPLAAGQPLGFTDIKIAFDLLVHAADGLDFALLVHRTGDRNPLIQGNIRKAGKHRVQLRGRSTVAVHARIALFKGDARRKSQRLALGKGPAQVTGKDKHPLVVGVAAHARFPFDVDNPFAPHEGLRGYPRWSAKREVTDLKNGQTVYLSSHKAVHIDKDRVIHV